MGDIDIDSFGEHESRPEEPTDENIPLIPGRGGVQTWDPRPSQSAEHEQETSFGGRESQRTKLMKDYVKDLYKKLSLMKPQNYFTTIILNSKMGNCITEAIESP